MRLNHLAGGASVLSFRLYRSPDAMVATCRRAAKAIRITNKAWRNGGGGSAGGSSRVSSRLRLRVPAVIECLSCQKLERAIRSVIRRNHRCDICPSAPATEAVFLRASRSVPASGDIGRRAYYPWGV